MKRIIAIRHGQSEGNKQRLIQGTCNDYDLTEEGKEYIEKLTDENLETLLECDRIINSPLKRAEQTASVIQEKTGKPRFTDQLLVEFNPGILSGKTHDECKENYPEYYKVWTDRKDLDKIPGAEKGKELQARALAFLIKYFDKEDYNDIIVSHAGFLRCLVNTAKGRDRTTPIEIHNGVIHALENPLENIHIEQKLRAMTSKVYIVDVPDGKYVLKRKTRAISDKDREEKRILDELDGKIPNLPTVIGLFEDEEGSTKVIEYVQGKHIYGKLNRKQEIALIKDFIILKNNLAEISSDSYEKIDLIKDMKQMQSTCTADYEKKYAQKILYDFKNISKLNSSKYVLCHNDLNRDNILFDEDGNGQIKANFIDWEGLDLCPKEYQFATFLTSSFLIEGYKADETMKFAKILDKDVDEDFLSYLMQIRVFKGLHFFAEARNKYTKSNEEASKEILIKYYNAAEGLQKYREDRGFDKETKKNEMKFLVDFERE